MEKSTSMQPQGCPLSVCFLNWATYRCVLGKETLRIHSQKRGQTIYPSWWPSLTKDCYVYLPHQHEA